MTHSTQAPNGERREFPARLACLAAAAAFAQDFCARNRIAHPVVLRLTLVIEELFTNTVKHGHGGDCDAPISITLSTADGGVTLCYEDAGPRFDPLPHMRTPPENLDAPSPARPVGGLGLHLVGQMATQIRYAYASGNKLDLTLRVSQTESGD